MYVWLAIVVPRPHKEERFLFPIYPILCLGAAMVGNAVMEEVVAILLSPSTGSASPKQHSRWSLWLQLVLWTPAAILGGSRTVALTKYYTAPFHVYAHFQKEQPLLSRTLVYATIERGGNDETTQNSSTTMSTMTTTTICTCSEWYRFPSSFYLPSSDRSIVNFKFVSPSPYFEGQLPHAFLPQGSGLGATYTPFNDKNMPEYDDRYVPIDACDYLVDATWGEVKDENVQQDNTPSCRDNDSQWLPILTSAFLDADRTSTLHRILYLPKLHEQADLHGGVEYVDYVLYRRIQGEDDDDAEDVEEEETGAHSPHA
jgi:alpha-1,2-mannosyltransferase